MTGHILTMLWGTGNITIIFERLSWYHFANINNDDFTVRVPSLRRAQRSARFRSNSTEEARPDWCSGIIGLHNEDNLVDNRQSPGVASRTNSRSADHDRVRNDGSRDTDRARSQQRRGYDQHRRCRRHHITPRPSPSRTRSRSNTRRGSPIDNHTSHHTASRHTPRRQASHDSRYR